MQSQALTEAGIPHQICGDETLFDIYFTDRACTDYRSATHDDPDQSARYNAVLRENGVFKSPGKLYPSLAITEDDFDLTARAVEKAVQALVT